MDVQSLYPKIDHKEGIDASSQVLVKKINQLFPTRIAVKLMQLILKCNIILPPNQGTTMDTPMAVSYANISMSEFKQHLLHGYEQRYSPMAEIHR